MPRPRAAASARRIFSVRDAGDGRGPTSSAGDERRLEAVHVGTVAVADAAQRFAVERSSITVDLG
jgi:hypothetical protein